MKWQQIRRYNAASEYEVEKILKKRAGSRHSAVARHDKDKLDKLEDFRLQNPIFRNKTHAGMTRCSCRMLNNKDAENLNQLWEGMPQKEVKKRGDFAAGT